MNIVMGIIVIVLAFITLPIVNEGLSNFSSVSVPVQAFIDLGPIIYILAMTVVAVYYFAKGRQQ